MSVRVSRRRVCRHIFSVLFLEMFAASFSTATLAKQYPVKLSLLRKLVSAPFEGTLPSSIGMSFVDGKQRSEELQFAPNLLRIRGGELRADAQKIPGSGQDLQPRKLYGGAISMSVPARFLDISDIRPVPDFQEVLVDAEADESVITEILQRDEDLQDHEIAEHIFREHAVENNATECEIISTRRVADEEVPLLTADPPCPKSWLSLHHLLGSQRASKFKESSRNRVLLHLFVARLPNVRAELVVLYMQPVELDADSSSAQVATIRSSYEDGQRLMEGMLRTLDVRDWTLFGALD